MYVEPEAVLTPQGMEPNSWNSTGTDESRILGSTGASTQPIAPLQPQHMHEDTDMFPLDMDLDNDMTIGSALPAVQQPYMSHVLPPPVPSHAMWGDSPTKPQHRTPCVAASSSASSLVQPPLYKALDLEQELRAEHIFMPDDLGPQSAMLVPSMSPLSPQHHHGSREQGSNASQPSPLCTAMRSSRGNIDKYAAASSPPPVWVSGDGTPCMSPPESSQHGPTSMMSIPESLPASAKSQWLSASACSVPAGHSSWPSRPGSLTDLPSLTLAEQHPAHVVQIPMQPNSSQHYTDSRMLFGSAPCSWIPDNPSSVQTPDMSTSWSDWGYDTGHHLDELFESGVARHKGFKSSLAADGKRALLDSGIACQASSHPLQRQQPQSAPPLAPLRFSSRLQGRGKQTYSEYDREAFSHSESESEMGSNGAAGNSGDAVASSPDKLHLQHVGGFSSEEEDLHSAPLAVSGTVSGTSWTRRLDKQRSLGGPEPLQGAGGSVNFVSRSGRTVKPGLRAYSPSPARELSSSLPRNYGSTARVSTSAGGGTIKRKRAIHTPVALRDSLDADLAGQRRKQHNPWTREETEALVEGVQQCGGAGKWQDIKRLGLAPLQGRSAVDLKDKWRNLLRVAELPPALSSARAERKRDGPSSVILDRVRELAVVTMAKAAASETRIASSRPRARGRMPSR